VLPSVSPSSYIEIFMPYYGDPDLLREAVESVLAQDDDQWRLVVVDDCYPDVEPGRWVSQIDDERVSYVRNETNLGVSGTFQRCLDLATAPWLTIMGCDDRLLPGYVQRVRKAVEAHPDAAWVQPGVVVIDEAGREYLPLPDRLKNFYRPHVTTTTVLGGERLSRSLLRGNWTYFPSLCWRHEVVAAHGFRPEFEIVLDLSLQLDLIAEGHQLVLDPVPSFEYRRHSASVSSVGAGDGSRFVEEKALLLRTADTVGRLGWRRARRAASWHLSSRLNALSRLPSVLRSRQLSSLAPLLRHAFTNRLPQGTGR
jgi:glycosyltransferase involved in cell wall biosynthesis